MSRQEVLAVTVPSVEERRRAIERETLPANIGALLDAAADEVPERQALNFFESGEALTYAGLRAQVNRLANGLARAGVRRGSHVGVMLPNIAALPVTWLALGRLGAVMVPMNIAYTAREMTYVIEDGEVDQLVIHEDCLPTLAGLSPLPARLKPECIFVVGAGDGGFRRWDRLIEGERSDFTPMAAVGLDDLLNIQYTSGTTGFPKGCMLPHRYWLTIGRVNAFRDGRDYRRILAATPFFYMDPQWLTTMTFWRRATLFVARRQSASRFMDWVREHRIQFTLFPELVFKQPPNLRDRENEIIRVNMYGLHKENHAALEERFDFIAREAFGMTEIGSGMFMPIEATDMVGSGSCGKPSPYREARIVDAEDRPVRQGEVGELQIRGPGMLQGYYNKPEATAAALKDGWFRTGDLFRQDERGYFYIVGRLKDMIRRAGENIAAREVEAVLRGMPEVVEAAAVPVPDDTRGQEVKVYLVLKPGLKPADLPPERLIQFCEANLAKFKVPRYIAYIDKLPKTPSEKIAKQKLVQDVADLRQGSFDRVVGKWL
ncbi:MAG: AMP-binding protein [Alphaproteobacteria bacterium]|nr:AMP-binding protein [Alphaproteobacteria bacterium]